MSPLNTLGGWFFIKCTFEKIPPPPLVQPLFCMQKNVDRRDLNPMVCESNSISMRHDMVKNPQNPLVENFPKIVSNVFV